RPALRVLAADDRGLVVDAREPQVDRRAVDEPRRRAAAGQLDVHDRRGRVRGERCGLGPALAAAKLRIETAQNLVGGEHPRVTALLADAAREVSGAVDD